MRKAHLKAMTNSREFLQQVGINVVACTQVGSNHIDWAVINTPREVLRALKQTKMFKQVAKINCQGTILELKEGFGEVAISGSRETASVITLYHS